MQAAKACLLALGFVFLLGCNSLSSPGSNSDNHDVPTPSIASFSPSSAPQGSPDVFINIEGTHFMPPVPFGAAVSWSTDGGHTSAFLGINQVNDTHITAVIPAALLVSAASATLQVQIYYRDGDSPRATSNTVEFKVTN